MRIKFRALIVAIFWIFPLLLNAKTYYVAIDGNDANTGDGIAVPYKTITKAVSVVKPGDIISVRSGVHAYNSTINISKSGTVTDTCFLLSYPGERAVLDFSGTSSGKRGISLTGNYWSIKGFDVIYAGDNGLNISGGGNNCIEFCSFYENEDSGVQLGGGAHDNTFINCDSYYNADPPDYADADGFAPKLDVGTNNRFIGCRAWGNCDDGWDGYMRGGTNVTTILENCWTWGNGYLEDGTDPGSQANGNGFKMGGGDNSNNQNLMHHFYLTRCIAFGNKGKGFDQNNNVGSMSMLNCTGYKNKTANYRITKGLAVGQALVVKNSVSYDGAAELGSFAIQEKNSWLAPFFVSSEDFVTLDTTGVTAPRKPDGSLPDINFLHLAAGSDLVDAGANVGLEYFGQAPDLGAFEFGLSSSSPNMTATDNITVYFSKGDLVVRMQEPAWNSLKCRVFNLYGQAVFESLTNSETNIIKLPPIKKGLYFIELEIGEGRVVKKIML